LVTNTLPAGTVPLSVSLPTEVRTNANVFTWTAGTLAAGAERTLTFLVRLPTAGSASITAAGQATSTLDASLANNVVSNAISIQPHVTNTLAITRGPQVFNRLNSLFEELVTIRNIGVGTAVNPRLIISGVAEPNRLYPVSGTNGTAPFSITSISIGAGTNAIVTNYYFFKDRTTNASITISAVESPNSANVAVSTNVVATVPTISTNGAVAFNFAMTAGRNYVIQASDNVLFTNFVSFQSVTNATTNSVRITDNLTTNGAPIPARFFRALETTR
jgi:hypothetical protein